MVCGGWNGRVELELGGRYGVGRVETSREGENVTNNAQNHPPNTKLPSLYKTARQVQNRPLDLRFRPKIEGLCLNWEGVFVYGGRKGRADLELGGRKGRADLGTGRGYGLWRAERVLIRRHRQSMRERSLNKPMESVTKVQIIRSQV